MSLVPRFGFALAKKRCYIPALRQGIRWRSLIPGSSAVEQATVNRLAGGSNPSRGAKTSFYTLPFISFNAQ